MSRESAEIDETYDPNFSRCGSVGAFCGATIPVEIYPQQYDVVFLVSGQDKALPVKAVLEGRREPQQLPAQLIRPESGKLIWLLDSAAASLLGTESLALVNPEDIQSDLLGSISDLIPGNDQQAAGS